MKVKKLLRDGDDFSRLGFSVIVILVALMFVLAGVNQLAMFGAGVTLLVLLIVAFSEVFFEILQYALYSLKHWRK